MIIPPQHCRINHCTFYSAKYLYVHVLYFNAHFTYTTYHEQIQSPAMLFILKEHRGMHNVENY